MRSLPVALVEALREAGAAALPESAVPIDALARGCRAAAGADAGADGGFVKAIKKRMSVYERAQTKRALARQPLNMSRITREAHRNQEHAIVAGALFREDALLLVSSFAYMLPDTESARETVAGIIEKGLRDAAVAALARVVRP